MFCLVRATWDNGTRHLSPLQEQNKDFVLYLFLPRCWDHMFVQIYFTHLHLGYFWAYMFNRQAANGVRQYSIWEEYKAQKQLGTGDLSLSLGPTSLLAQLSQWVMWRLFFVCFHVKHKLQKQLTGNLPITTTRGRHAKCNIWHLQH